MYLHWWSDGALMFGKEGFPNAALFRLPSPGGSPQKVGDLVSANRVHEIRVHPDGRQTIFQSYVTDTELGALENFLPKDLIERWIRSMSRILIVETIRPSSAVCGTTWSSSRTRY